MAGTFLARLRRLAGRARPDGRDSPEIRRIRRRTVVHRGVTEGAYGSQQHLGRPAALAPLSGGWSAYAAVRDHRGFAVAGIRRDHGPGTDPVVYGGRVDLSGGRHGGHVERRHHTALLISA